MNWLTTNCVASNQLAKFGDEKHIQEIAKFAARSGAVIELRYLECIYYSFMNTHMNI